MLDFNLVLAIVISISMHEYAHAYMAWKFGDDSPILQDRLTLNPLAHLDPLGTLFIFLVGIGWGKAVVINTQAFANYKKGVFWVSIVWPLMNLMLAVIAVFLRSHFIESLSLIKDFLDTLIGLNIVLFIFNILPIPPLDGSKIVFSLMPAKYDNWVKKYLLKGHYLLMAVLLIEIVFDIAILGRVIAPLRDFLISFLFANL